MQQALDFDRMNGNKDWQEAIQKEIDSLNALKCFDCKSPNFKPENDYKYVTLRMVFDVRQDLCLKARLAIGDHVIDAGHLHTYASVIKVTSAHLL